MPGIIPGRPDIKYSLSFSHKYIHTGLLHTQIFGKETIVTIAVEETKMGKKRQKWGGSPSTNREHRTQPCPHPFPATLQQSRALLNISGHWCCKTHTSRYPGAAPLPQVSTDVAPERGQSWVRDRKGRGQPTCRQDQTQDTHHPEIIRPSQGRLGNNLNVRQWINGYRKGHTPIHTHTGILFS